MSTYTSPVSVADFQTYINDVSEDEDILAFYQILLERATEQIYTYLDRDYTASAEKEKRFWGTGTTAVYLHEKAGAITSWQTVDLEGVPTPMISAELALFEHGLLIIRTNGVFERGFEHRIVYTLPDDLACPESVQQAIIEVAAIMLRHSGLGNNTLSVASEWLKEHSISSGRRYEALTIRQRLLLSPYIRYAI